MMQQVLLMPKSVVSLEIKNGLEASKIRESSGDPKQAQPNSDYGL
jgi:hypothetical protein